MSKTPLPLWLKPFKFAFVQPVEPTTVKREHCKESEYLERVVDPTRRAVTVERSLELLRPIADEFDSIVVTGSSGLTMGAILAHELNKNLVIVRKDSEKSHSHYAVEGDAGGSYLIVDDLYCSGETLRRILNVMVRELGNRLQCRGFFAYNYVECDPLTPYHLGRFEKDFGIKRIC